MSIIVEGMEMPKNKDGKPLWIGILEDGTVAAPSSSGFLIVYPHVKAIEVRPHGRLIDADAISEDDRQVYGFYNSFDLQQLLDNAPTIIEAEV